MTERDKNYSPEDQEASATEIIKKVIGPPSVEREATDAAGELLGAIKRRRIEQERRRRRDLGLAAHEVKATRLFLEELARDNASLAVRQATIDALLAEQEEYAVAREREANQAALQRRSTRREIDKSLIMFGTGSAVFGGTILGFRKLAEETEKRAKEDHYKDIPLDEYAEDTFYVVYRFSSSSNSYIISSDPVTDPQRRYNTDLIHYINDRYVSGHFNITNPGIIRAKDPYTLKDGAPWMVLNARVEIPSNRWWKKLNPDLASKLLYVYLPDHFYIDDQKILRTFVPLATNQDGTHVVAATGEQVKNLGRISFPYDGGPTFYGGGFGRI